MSNKQLKVGIISQARVSSTRLFGKVLLKAQNKTILAHHINRLKWSNLPVYIATTTNTSDDPIVLLAQELDIPLHRGSEHNVLERYFETARKFELDIIIRVTSDCPLIDGHLIKDSLSKYLEVYSDHLYASNCLKRSYPRGFDFEIFSFQMLKEAYTNAKNNVDLEHVTVYMQENRSKNITFKHFINDEDKSKYRITLDVEEDWILIRKLIEEFGVINMGYREIIKILDHQPELAKINSAIQQKAT